MHLNGVPSGVGTYASNSPGSTIYATIENGERHGFAIFNYYILEYVNNFQVEVRNGKKNGLGTHRLPT